MKRQKAQQGFTLMELMIYLSIVTIALLVFTTFMIDVTKHAARAKVAKEVQQNARLAMLRITQAIRNAPTPVTVSGSSMTAGGVSYALVGDELQVDGMALTSSNVRVTSLQFTQNAPSDPITVTVVVEQDNPNAQVGARQRIQLSSSAVPRSQLY